MQTDIARYSMQYRLQVRFIKTTYLPTHIFISSFKAVGLRTNSIAQCEQLCDVKDTDLNEKNRESKQKPVKTDNKRYADPVGYEYKT